MARPKEFDEERAVRSAMRTFIELGYEATSTQDLVEATGLGRSSIYNTFKSKHELFTRALEHYMRLRTDNIVAVLDEPRPLRGRLRALLEQAAAPPDGDPTGCLVVHSMIEMAPRHPDVAAALRRDYDRRHAALKAAIEAGKASGEIDSDRDADSAAHFVIAAVSGTIVAQRGGADPSVLEGIADNALRVL
ncbi:TetR/AcrR family transcriptional regulator [Salininema proteolyticum]|uniref:TetR/AcrR family transcriptional regulator n=1 Tax=Salininema proteolyticum TaxID=1607685 RepID=A0ABV8U324_9ACTN